MVVEWTELETSLGVVARLRNMEMYTPKEAQDSETVLPEPRWPQSGSVVFDNIEAAYNTNCDPVLRNVSFKVEAGQKAAICGRIGSTISTTIMSRTLLRSHLNIIPQEPILFLGSVRMNAIPFISSLSSFKDNNIITALTIVGFWTIIYSRGGLDADMSSIPLSEGQKQLFCLARALLRRDKCPILVLDEAKSNTDHHTDEQMQRIIREEWKDKTVIAVVHKLKTVMDCDGIAVLEKGGLVEFDAPAELLKREGGVFKGLWDSQR
ncbi:related to multidrug resistance-associated protein/mitoxantrone resistance protein, ABC superfamily [Phialocephala subalpina]|uniref:Related to multidrug resistance-associated protein/mitoxantrone resistance protein, ABC superfamily n=1 Tax=Phialocephala subalpina TaxID=576137 RepID=A0A1L7XN39_9HELO|nr:related to multidrug resistance-associated protein/mitoxantrone resistance protein, ABC superfamily [Phialocephala subalpina]